MKNLKELLSGVARYICIGCQDAKVDGTFIEVGGAVPYVGNTWLLEEGYNWRGFY